MGFLNFRSARQVGVPVVHYVTMNNIIYIILPVFADVASLDLDSFSACNLSRKACLLFRMSSVEGVGLLLAHKSEVVG